MIQPLLYDIGIPGIYNLVKVTMLGGSDKGDYSRRDRSFADAMRDAGGKPPTWTGSVIRTVTGAPTKEERERIKDDVRARDAQARVGRPWYLSPGSTQFVPAGCFVILAVLAGIALLFSGLEIAIWLEYSLLDPGKSFPLLLESLVARVLYLLVKVVLAVVFFMLARRYQKDYRRRMEELVRDTPDKELLDPVDADLNAAYDHLPRLAQRILLRRPRFQKEWADFLHRDFDVYMASKGRYRIPFLEWAGRFWLYIWLIAKFVLFIPESAFQHSLFNLLAARAGFTNDTYFYPGSTAALIAVLFAGHALGLLETRMTVVRNAIYHRAPCNPAFTPPDRSPQAPPPV